MTPNIVKRFLNSNNSVLPFLLMFKTLFFVYIALFFYKDYPFFVKNEREFVSGWFGFISGQFCVETP
jgi:hypothetical protein